MSYSRQLAAQKPMGGSPIVHSHDRSSEIDVIAYKVSSSNHANLKLRRAIYQSTRVQRHCFTSLRLPKPEENPTDSVFCATEVLRKPIRGLCGAVGMLGIVTLPQCTSQRPSRQIGAGGVEEDQPAVALKALNLPQEGLHSPIGRACLGKLQLGGEG